MPTENETTPLFCEALSSLALRNNRWTNGPNKPLRFARNGKR